MDYVITKMDGRISKKKKERRRILHERTYGMKPPP
jgi:hypothetical protein